MIVDRCVCGHDVFFVEDNVIAQIKCSNPKCAACTPWLSDYGNLYEAWNAMQEAARKEEGK